MTRLLRAELRKVFTTRLWWGMLLGALAFTALEVVALIATAGLKRSQSPPLTTAVAQRTLLASPRDAYIFSLIVGIIMITTEFRHFTTRPTFLSQPHRGRVIVAKVVVAALVGLIYGVAATVVALAIAVPWLNAKGITMNWAGNDLGLVILAAIAVVTIYAIVGLGIGCLIRNQIAAVIASLVYLLVIESIIGGLATLWAWLGDIYKYLPGAASSAVTQVDVHKTTLLAPWAGGLVLLGWGVLFALLGWVEARSRDIP
jgi:hypothetical protein